MYPESYPKKIPPNDAKAQIRYAFQVTGASIWLMSCAVESDLIPSPAAMVTIYWLG